MKNKLKTYRKNARLTQKQLGILVGVCPDYISMIERGIRDPGFKLARQISNIFSVEINEIFF